MKCRDAHEMLNSYFDNRIDPMNDTLLAEHIKSCPKCRAELDFLISYRKILKTVKPVPTPDNFLDELHKRINPETKENSFIKIYNNLRYSISSFSFPLEAAGVLALTIVVFFLYRPFFNEKVPEMSSESAIESPREEKTSMKKIGKSESAEKAVQSDKFSSDYEIMKEKSDSAPGKEIIGETSPVSDTADDNVSAKTESSYPDIKEMKKSRSMESEKVSSTDEEKSFSSESDYSSDDSKGSIASQKDAPAADMSFPDNLFIKYNVSVVTKDLSDRQAFYRIKVNPEKCNPLIKDLKVNSAVEVRRIIKTKYFYEIEFLIKKP